VPLGRDARWMLYAWDRMGSGALALLSACGTYVCCSAVPRIVAIAARPCWMFCQSEAGSHILAAHRRTGCGLGPCFP
jgi:hypothetical protein